MHHHHGSPDLNLASSYIPACLCVLKCSLSFILFIFAPTRGWIGVGCLLIVDRLLWNTSSGSILDVNAVCIALVGGLMVAHSRADGIHTMVHWAVIGVWAMVSALQVLGLTRIRRSHEILLGACAVTVLSCLFEAQERAEFLALRAFAFTVANTALPYFAVVMQQMDIDTYVNVCRTLLILLTDLQVACSWVVIYILCLGYQLHAVKPLVLKRKGFASPQEIMLMPPSSPIGSVHKLNISSPREEMMASTDTEEANLLREALANRRVGMKD